MTLEQIKRALNNSSYSQQSSNAARETVRSAAKEANGIIRDLHRSSKADHKSTARIRKVRSSVSLQAL